MEVEEERQDFANNSEDDEGEVVNIEYDDSDEKEQTRDEIDRDLTKTEGYPCESNSPSNSSEDGQTTHFVTKKPGRKTDRQRVESGARREWSDTEILSLIKLWRGNDILYNTNHPLYYVQTERKLAMDHISNDLRISVKDVNDKMHSLRTYYCSQRQRLGSLISSHGDTKQFSRWKFYDQMSFLYESVTNRAFKSSLSGKSRRKRDLTRTDLTPYLNIHGDHIQSRSPHNTYETGYQIGYTDRPSSIHERDDKETILNPSRMLPDHNHRKSLEENEQSVDHKEQSFVYSNLVLPKEFITDKEGVKVNSCDEMFGHMVSTSLSQIEDEQQKELLKLNVQTMIYNVRFRKGLQQSAFTT